MRAFNATLALVMAMGAPPAAFAQDQDVRAQLAARGAPPEFVERVATIVAEAAAEGLPAEPLVAKALEGWAKRGQVPPDRVVTVLERLTGQFREARGLVIAAGLDDAPGAVVAAAGSALGRGLTAEQIGELIEAAPTPEAAATGITVASSLGGQGLERAAAVRAVRDAQQQGRSPGELLELPSVLADLIARGVPMSDVAQMVLQGNGMPGAGNAGGGPAAGRPGVVPPGRPDAPPGQTKRRRP